MTINDFILKNEKLASEMQIYSDEINRLIAFKNLLIDSPAKRKNYDPYLLGRITKCINSSKAHFNFINDAYDQNAHLQQDKNTLAFISEVKQGYEDIETLFSNLKY